MGAFCLGPLINILGMLVAPGGTILGRFVAFSFLIRLAFNILACPENHKNLFYLLTQARPRNKHPS
ncbi:MAG TPA: hypothetical protein DD656_07685, partial [Alphaproteobacteria bacterium]|nr:hypothetical protein [Alphaproteobacteria bacterium]